MTGSHTRGVQKRSACATGAIDNCLGQNLNVLGIVGFFVRDIVDEPTPTTPNSNDSMSVAQSANGDRSNCGIQSGHVATARQNTYRAFRQLALLDWDVTRV